MTELQEYHDAFNDCWQFLKQYMSTGNPCTDEYWADAMIHANELDKKYGKELVRCILVDIIGELERKYLREAREAAE